MSGDALWQGVARLEQQIAALQARQLRLLARAAADIPAVEAMDGRDWAQDKLAVTLRISANAAADRLTLARFLQQRSATADALSVGRIGLGHVRVLERETTNLPAQVAAAVETAVLHLASRQTPATFRAAVRRAALRCAGPAHVEARRLQARAGRQVIGMPIEDSMGLLRAVLPVEDLATVLTAVNAVAERVEPGDQRTADQRRADALVQICAGVLSGAPVESLLTEHGRRPAIAVTVCASTLVGIDDEPAYLDGYGSISAGLARRIAADPTGTWRRLLTDDAGRLLDYGRRTYRPPVDLADFVLARDRTCVFPGCNRRAARCDIDHRRPWDDGGRTDRDNLQTLCRRHHLLKHRGGWRTQALRDGTTRWTDSYGRTHDRPPATYPVSPSAPERPPRPP